MVARLLDIVASLVHIIEHETDKLRSASPYADRAEIAVAKARLVAQLELRVIEMRRDDDAELKGLSTDLRRDLAEQFERLAEAASANGEALRRQIELSTEMMAAVATEAQRLLGTRASSYGPFGEIWKHDAPAPISLNASL